MWNAGLDESQAGIKTARRSINNLRYRRGTEERLDESVTGEWKSLKLNIQKTKIVPFSPITSWQIEGEKVEIVRDFIFLGSKITLDRDCSHEIKNTCSLEEKLWQTYTVL